MSDVEVEQRGHAGLITLNRSKALNALTLDMVTAIGAALDRFESDLAVTTVVVRSAVPGVFCAGGDVRRIREMSLDGRIDEAAQFFRTEFALNLRIARYSKPYVALIDGTCFGGGLGLSVHGRARVVGPKAVMAMPETAIGYFPDVGASCFLARLPPGVGLWLGLTGARVNAQQALDLGLATHALAPGNFCDLTDRLAAGEQLDAALVTVGARQNESRLDPALEELTRHFEQDDVDSIVRSLSGADHPAAAEALAALRAASPRSLRVTFDLIRQGRGASLEDCLAREQIAAEAAVQHQDFVEGVRAVLVDKDRTPRWAG